LPSRKNSLFQLFKVTSVDILYKESDALAVKVVDTISRATIEAAADANTSSILTYEYNSKKPFKTLPSDEITRVFDKVPVRAFAQEISANRIIYGNFQTKHTPPETIDYSVNVGEKEDNTGETPVIPITAIESKVGKLEYPSSTLKQNRTYQVGIVLSDRFGRQSTVVLSNQDGTVQSDTSQFGGSTTYTGYLGETINKAAFPGNALRVLFNQPIGPDAPNANTGWPGIYNGTVASASYNPLGWHSYKIVVKQQEQEYYNVYLPGVLAAYPDDKTKELGKTSHTVLINDNINKVPRDLNEVGPTQKQFRSSVDLNGRVENENTLPGNSFQTNKQFYPTKAGDIVSTIASDDDLFNGENINVNFIPSQAFYSIESNPFIARISTTKLFGVVNTNATRITTAQQSPNSTTIDLSSAGGVGVILVGDTITGGTVVPGTIVTVITSATVIVVNKEQTLAGSTVLNFHKNTPILSLQNLAVFETDPVLSELDIFWETSSTGLITDLNQAIIDDSSAEASLSGFNANNFTEAIVPGISASNVNPLLGVGNITIVDQSSAIYKYGSGVDQGILTLVSVFDTTGAGQASDRSDEFVLNDNNTAGDDGVYTVGVKGNVENPYYYYGFPLAARSFRFLFRTVVNGIIQEFQEDVTLGNVTPSITGCVAAVTPTGGNGVAFSTIATLDAVNGSAYGLNKQTDLTWTLTEAAGNNYFNIAVSTVLTSAGNNALRAIITVNTLGGDPPNGDYTLRASVKDAGNLSAACNFIVTINVAVCQFIRSSQANPRPDVPFDAAGNEPCKMNITVQNCNGGTTIQNQDADGTAYCTQALGSSVAWELVNPPANVPVADRTGIFNDTNNQANCGTQ